MANTNIYDMTDTWNAGGTTFTSIKMNVTDTASASGSLLLDLQVSASSKFSVSKAGAVVAASTITSTAGLIGTTGTFSSTVTTTGLTAASGTITANANALTITQTWNNAGVTFTGGMLMNITNSASASGSALATFQVGGANRYEYRPARMNFYNTYTDASNYEAFGIEWFSNEAYFLTDAAGTGSSRNMTIRAGGGTLKFGVGSSTVQWQVTSTAMSAISDNTVDVGSSGGNRPRTIYAATSMISAGLVKTGSTTVASLPSASTSGAGARHFVSDSSVTTFGSTVSAGGSSLVPVYSDGTNWKVG